MSMKANDILGAIVKGQKKVSRQRPTKRLERTADASAQPQWRWPS